MRGVVKFFDAERGYGFIVPNDGGKDVFVHFTAIAGEPNYRGRKNLEAETMVEFDVVAGHGSHKDEMQAANVRTV